MWNSVGETTKEIVVVADRRRVRMPKRRVGPLVENQAPGGRLRFGLRGLESLGTSFDIRHPTSDIRRSTLIVRRSPLGKQSPGGGPETRIQVAGRGRGLRKRIKAVD
jgi:hypothetical protein